MDINTRVNAWIDAHVDELVEAAARLIRCQSVNQPAMGDHPFGDDVAAALDEGLALATEWGFETKNYDYYAGTAQLGEGEPRLGILCHLDTVPLGEGWSVPPLGGEVHDGKLFGRGAIDDKGPAAAALFAMRALRECGVTLSAPCLCVLGCDEETGMTDMEYYGAKAGFPPLLFCPDGSYPVINTEKGRVRLTVKAPVTDKRLLRAEGGVAFNAVPTEAHALLSGVSEQEARAAAAAVGHAVEWEERAEGALLITRGVATHGSTPEKGKNAVTALLEVLAAMGVGGETIAAAARHFPFAETGGESAGAACCDEVSGPLTLAVTYLSVGDGVLSATADIRFPVTETVTSVQARLTTGLSAAFEVGFDACVEGHHVPEDSALVQALLRVYERETGERGECLAIGGGTYAHDIPGGVAFGAEFPGVDNHMHGADEFISVEELRMNARLIAGAIAELCVDK